MSISKNISPCEYLFGQTADEVFQIGIKEKQLKIDKMDQSNKNAYEPKLYGLKQLKDKVRVIDQNLETIMHINSYLLSTHPNAISLINPKALNNQCHLYALRAVQIMRNYSQKSEEEKLARTKENLFLHLSFLLSYPLLNDKGLLIQIVRNTLKNIAKKNNKEIDLKEAKRLEIFLSDSKFIHSREQASLLALNKLFAEEMKTIFSNLDKESKIENEISLYSDLKKISLLDDLNIEYSKHNKKKLILYTLPKIASVPYLIDVLEKENIPLVIKLKIITKNGTATIVESSQKIKENSDPVIVFEAVSTDGSYSFLDCLNQDTLCPNSYFAHKNKIHKLEESCFLCKKNLIQEDELKLYRKQLQLIIESPKEMLYALGADFIITNQKKFKILFDKNETYPFLSEIFEKGILYKEKIKFDITHVHVDSAKYAVGSDHLYDTSTKLFLEERGLL